MDSQKDSRALPARNQLLAVVPLWFPLASETFIFREIALLRDLGAPVMVFTMYGKRDKGLSRQMREYDGRVQRFGSRATFAILAAFLRRLGKSPRETWRLMRRGLFRRMRNLESLAENTWCFLAGFALAEKLTAAGATLIHAPWANGPATASWVASQLTGIPFSFAGRAGDIFPPDGLLAEKAADAVFIRANNGASGRWLASFCPQGQEDKVKLVYNALVFSGNAAASRKAPEPPYKILAVGRFARTKGFTWLLEAMAILKKENFPARLTLAGDGSWRRKLEKLRDRLGIADMVDMPGFMPNDQLADLMRNHDLLVVPSVVYDNGDRDGIPNVIMEALSLELPVIATDVCGIPEVILDGKTGYIAPQRDARALANIMRDVLRDWPRAAETARAGKKLVAEMFDPQKNVAELWQLCEDAMKSKGSI